MPDGSRDTNQWHVDKELMLWFADRYGADKILGVEALAAWLQTKINNAHPCPPLFLWDYNEVEGHRPKGLAVRLSVLHVMCRWQAGTQGVYSVYRKLPYDVNNVEPEAPASNWSNTGGALQQCDTYPNNPPASKDPVRSTGNAVYDLHDGTNLNIHPAAVTTNGADNTAVVRWDVYDMGTRSTCLHSPA